jgi:hypothetical protein
MFILGSDYGKQAENLKSEATQIFFRSFFLRLLFLSFSLLLKFLPIATTTRFYFQ